MEFTLRSLLLGRLSIYSTITGKWQRRRVPPRQVACFLYLHRDSQAREGRRVRRRRPCGAHLDGAHELGKESALHDSAFRWKSEIARTHPAVGKRRREGGRTRRREKDAAGLRQRAIQIHRSCTALRRGAPKRKTDKSVRRDSGQI